MKKSLLAVILSLACVVQASQVLVEDNFTAKAPEIWKLVSKYGPFSAIEYTANGLVLKRNEAQKPIPGRLFDTAFQFHSVARELPEGADYYDLSVKVGTNKASFIPRGHGDGYQNRILWYDGEGRIIKESSYRPAFRFSLERPGWSSFRGEIPKGAISAEVQFGFDSPDFLEGESAILSGVKFIVGAKAEIMAIPGLGGLDHTPARLTPSPIADGSAQVRIHVPNASSVDWNASTILLDDKPVGALLSRDGEVFTYTPQAPLENGLHLFKFTLKDIGGNIENYGCPLYIGAPNTPNKMTIREDGMPMLNGKPFFMLGIACLVKQGRNNNSYDKAFEEAAAAGMNFARHWSSYNMDYNDAKDYIEAARKHNMYISMAASSAKNDTDVNRIAKGIIKQVEVDRILAWDIGDDTSSWITPEALLAKHNAIHSIDNSRLTTQADGMGGAGLGPEPLPKSHYTEYVKSSDTFQPEIYPIGNCEPGKETPEITAKAVPRVIKDMKQIQHDWKVNDASPRPIWPLIQYFHYAPNGRRWNRMPTRDELRAMSYLAVIHGSHGIFWYRYAGYSNTENARRGYSDEQWKTLAGISLEFRALYDMYCTLPVPQTQTVAVISGPAKDAIGFDSVNTLLKRHDGKAYLIVCNSAMADVKARFTVPGAKSVKEYFEKREFNVADGAFEDAFGGFGVHVYVIE